MFSSNIFSVLNFRFLSLIHLELVFDKVIDTYSSIGGHLVFPLLFFTLQVSTILSNVKCLNVSVFIFEYTALFHCTPQLDLFKYHVAIVTVAL